LTRHWRIAHHAENSDATSSASLSDATAIGTAQTQNSSHVLGTASNGLHIAGAAGSNGELITQAHRSPIDLNVPTAPFQNAHAHLIAPGKPVQDNSSSDLCQTKADHVELHPPTYHDEGFDEFRDFVNFIDGVGLSAQWTPEYDFDWMRFDDQHQPSRRHSVEPNGMHSPAAGDIGTPFSTWLPSAPADDQVRLASNVGDGTLDLPLRASAQRILKDDIDVRERRTKNGTYHVTDDHRNFLVSLLESLPFPTINFEIPSRHTLTRYITAFFGGFHSHFPFIHVPTYKPSCSPVELTLAMCAAGAQYCFERRSAERLFRVAKAIVFDRLRQEQSLFGPQTLAFMTSESPRSPENASASRRSGPWSPLDLAKTVLILVGFATWERKDLLQEAFVLRGLLVQILRDIGMREEQPSSSGSTSRSAMWDQWVQRESSRRTKLVAFCYINVHTIAYDTYPLLWSSELHLRLPCCTSNWEATSAAQWAASQRDGKEDQMLFQQALSILLQGTTGADSVVPIPSPIGNYILLHALLQRIHVVRELSFSASSSATLSASELELISRALRSWTSLWQQTPESMLDPNNESGPIPFTSSALLVVAYVRLSLNIGPHRRLDCRDAGITACGLTTLPDIERNENLLSALLYSTHALSIPVRLGIDRVARSQAFFWSVQHAISSFECAIFLGKWLCAIPRPLREMALSHSEHRILHWVRCIIKEAYAVTDFEEAEEGLDVPHEPFALGLAVLNIWCRFFRGNTQWQFVVNLGLSLEKYMETLA
jgi:hypothetical protein